jgi:hypothetical protein
MMESAVLMGDGRICMWPAITVSEALKGLHKACITSGAILVECTISKTQSRKCLWLSNPLLAFVLFQVWDSGFCKHCLVRSV